MATSKAQKAWDDLNDRQQTYMTVILREDESREEAHRAESARTWSHTPARVWRRIPLNSAGATLARALRSAGVYDTGTGSTLAALADRGLIEIEHVPGILSTITCVRLTPAGRAAARAGLGYGPRWVKPKWALSEWLWRQLVKVVEAGPDGLLSEKLWGDSHCYLVDGYAVRGNRPYLKSTKVQIKVNRAGPGEEPYFTTREERRCFLTDTGRAHYAEHLADYREMYPDIDAPDLPASEVDAAPAAPGTLTA